DAFSEIAKYFKNLKNPKVISPDEGALDTAKECAKILKCESNYLVKKRDRVTGKIVIKDKNLGVEGKDVLIADDIISSGGTMIEALKVIKKQSPASINLACVHGVFCDAENFLMLKILADELVATNSIPNKVAKIDLSGLIAEELVTNLIKKKK
ncbi:MAG: phosphoribosylpyrophosphate synthetase, partial [Candidatus Altiarchaeales archaeon HGW-Altiarchaeales-2]